MPDSTMNSNPSVIGVKPETLKSMPRSVSNKIKVAFPTINDQNLDFIMTQINPYLVESFWATPKKVQVVINGFDSTGKNSFFTIFTFDNTNSGTFLFQYGYQNAITSVQSNQRDFISVTKYTIVNNAIVSPSTVSTSNTVTKDLIAVLYRPMISIISGMPFTDQTTLKLAFKHVLTATQSFMSQVPYINTPVSEASSTINSFISTGSFDYQPIRDEIIRICSITPTPIPEPSPKANKPNPFEGKFPPRIPRRHRPHRHFKELPK